MCGYMAKRGVRVLPPLKYVSEVLELVVFLLLEAGNSFFTVSLVTRI